MKNCYLALFSLECAVPENIHTPPPPTEDHRNSEGEGGLKALNFRGVRGLHEQFTFQGVQNRFENVQIEKYLRAYSIAKTVETLTSRNNE